MGQTLSEPVTTKDTAAGEDEALAWAVSNMQGWRISMEDAHQMILDLEGNSKSDEKTALFAVFDGHGGSEAAKFAAKRLHLALAGLDSYKGGDYRQALKDAFLKTDTDFFTEVDGDPSGCTAVAALLVNGPAPKDASKEKAPKQIYVANAGDSRSVLGLKGEAKPMSFDHKPGNKDENARIVAAGGFVEFGRVNGNLALSRAIGDAEFKRNSSLSAETQIVTADPEIIVHDVTGEEEFLVLACDGIWDCLSNQQVVDFVRRGIAQGKELTTICEEIMTHCLAPDSEIGGVGCDNMTFSVVAMLGGRTKEQWYSWVKERVEKKIGWDTPEEIAPVFQPRPAGEAGNGQQGRMNPQGLIQHLLPGGVGGLGGLAGAGAEGEEGGAGGQGGQGGMRGFRINPGGLAAALGGGRIVLRPGEPDEKGESTYEAHVVDEDDDSQDDEDDEDDAQGGSAKITQHDEGNSSVKPHALSEANRPNLTHQPEIVESPEQGGSSAGGVGAGAPSGAGSADFASVAARGVNESSPEAAKGASSASSKSGSDLVGVDTRPSTEGTDAEMQHAEEARKN